MFDPITATIGFFKGISTILGGLAGGAVSSGLQAIGVSATTANAIGGAISTAVYHGAQAMIYIGQSDASPPDVPTNGRGPA